MPERPLQSSSDEDNGLGFKGEGMGRKTRRATRVRNTSSRHSSHNMSQHPSLRERSPRRSTEREEGMVIGVAKKKEIGVSTRHRRASAHHGAAHP